MRKCPEKGRWLGHWMLALGTVMMLTIKTFGLRWFQTDNIYPIYNPQRWLGYLAAGFILYGIGDILVGRWRAQKEIYKETKFNDLVFPVLIVLTVLSGLAAHILRYAGFGLGCHYAYAMHVIIATPMLLIEMSFGKWSHMVYRPLALYFLAVRERANSRHLHRRQFQMSSENSKLQSVGAALVVGGGIGGMQAALDLAGAGIKVYLVESKPAIGGVMAQLDKTFPTNDCAMCTMAPRLVEIGRHKDIQILTLSEVERIEGEPGNFTVTIKKQARFIDETKCTGCGACITECPVTLPSEFDQGLADRKAIYRPFPQAVPNVFTISRRGTAPCHAACPIHQGGQAYVALIAQQRFDEALRVILRDNPLPSICGRVCTHPCADACTRGSVDDPVNLPALKRFVTDYYPDYKLPQPVVPDRAEKVAIIGSGPAGLVCAYQLRQQGYRPTIFEALSTAGGMLAVGIPAFRLPRRLLKAEIDRLRAIGIEIKLNTPVGHSIAFDELRKNFAPCSLPSAPTSNGNLMFPERTFPALSGASTSCAESISERP